MTAAPQPPAPTGLRVSDRGEDFIEWSWNAVERADGYDVQFSPNEAFTSEDEIIARTGEELSYRRGGLSAGTSAHLRVRSASGSGDDRITSDWSTHVTGMTAAPQPTPPPAPTGLRVSDRGENFIEWEWRAVPDVDGYLAEFSLSAAFTGSERRFETVETSLRIERLDPDTDGYLRVLSFVGSGSDRVRGAWSSVSVGTTERAPSSPSTRFGSGTWLVGSDIEPGRYFTNPDRGCYWERLSGLGGTSDDRITNDFISFDSTQVIVDIDPSDVAFSTNEACGTWDQSPVSPPAAGTIPPGTWLVGQVESGRYFTNPRDGCYWERLSGLGGTSDDRIANDFISFDSAQVIVDIDPSDVAFSTNEDCGMWDQSPVSPPDAGTIPPGIWLVGRQVEPGVYEVDAGDGCYWERLSGFGGTSDDRIANDFVSDGGRQSVEIARGDVGFSNDAACGTWRSIGGSTLGLPGGPMASETIEANRLLHEAHRDRRKPH